VIAFHGWAERVDNGLPYISRPVHTTQLFQAEVFMNYYLDVLKKYAVFTGRARRKEYWMFFLFNIIISFVIGFIDGLVGTVGILSIVYALGMLLPGLGVSIRRLHDTDRSGWWLFISLVPIVGFIVLLVFLVSDSQPGENKYGPNPKG
jgi:uncharacterized membrane protein YhaH (DUF805 family)